MTRNAIAWLEVNENKRSHLAQEAETNRHNVATEDENSRHNKVSEQIDLGALNESIRHNTTVEGETYRHNVATEKFNLDSLAESVRHNRATEGLQSEANRIQSVAVSNQRAYNDAMVSARNFENALANVKLNNEQSNRVKEIELKGVSLINELNNSKFKNASTISSIGTQLAQLVSRLGGK